jgi:superfamily I DNA and/or RNA helicase
LYESSEDENDNEAEANLVDVSNEEYERPDYSIGIILTYKAQVDLLQQMINDMNNDAFKQVQVSTVDAFQGAERDIIILGCVRTKNLGFTEDCRRLNVAITRARRHLIVIGKESLLRRNNNWRYIIEMAKSEKEKDKNYGYKRVEQFIRKGGNFKSMMKEFN